MTEKFYCVGCKEHYQLPVTEAVKKPSKGDSFRHSVVSYCPKGHKTTKICNKDDYDKYSSSKAAESPLPSGPAAGPSTTPLERTDTGVPSDFEAEESIKGDDCYQCGKCYTAFEDKDEADNCCTACYNCGYAAHVGFERAQKCCPCNCGEYGGGPNGTCQEMLSAETVVGTMSPGAGINAALEPLQGGLENGDEPSLVPADSFQPNGNGHVIGQETDSYNTTPMHAEDDFEPYFELCIVSNGTIGDIVGDYDEPESEKAFKEWEDAVNDGGPHVLIYYDSADADGMIVAGDDFMDVYWDAESESTGNRKAIMATAAAALVLALVWYRSSRN